MSASEKTATSTLAGGSGTADMLQATTPGAVATRSNECTRWKRGGGGGEQGHGEQQYT